MIPPLLVTMTIIYSTFPSEQTAQECAQKLLEQKVAACVLILPASSMCRWQGTIEKAREYLIMVKITDAAAQKAEKLIAANHPYQVPCIITCSGTAIEPYQAFLEQETQK